ASTRTARSVVTSAHAPRSRSNTPPGISTRVAPSRGLAAPAPPAIAIGGVGAPGPAGGRVWGVLTRPGPGPWACLPRRQLGRTLHPPHQPREQHGSVRRRQPVGGLGQTLWQLQVNVG